MSGLFFYEGAPMTKAPATTISATATVRVRGEQSAAIANTMAAVLGDALGSALRSAAGSLSDLRVQPPTGEC